MKILILISDNCDDFEFYKDSNLYHQNVAIDISNVIKENGDQCVIKKVNPNIYENIEKYKPELIFNLSNTIPADFFLQIQIPYTGPATEILKLALNKNLTQKHLANSGLPVHQSLLLSKDNWVDYMARIKYPAFVKPVIGGCSKGISELNLINNEYEAAQCFKFLINTGFESFLVEEYLPGREFSVALLGNGIPSFLPMIEYIFTENSLPYRDYQSKMLTSKKDIIVCPALLDEPLFSEIQNLAIKTFDIFKLKDFARIDMRVNHAGQPRIMDINAIPSLAVSDSSFVKMANAAGFTYPQLIQKICELALNRFNN